MTTLDKINIGIIAFNFSIIALNVWLIRDNRRRHRELWGAMR